jgi:hypothetical protein
MDYDKKQKSWEPVCFYLYKIGTVEQLRKTLKLRKNISDDMIVAKYGLSNDLDMEVLKYTEQLHNISSSQKIDLQLVYSTWIDDSYISTAEVDIKNYFENLDCLFKYKNMDELVIISQKQLNNMRKFYETVDEKYSGKLKTIKKHYEIEINSLTHSIDVTKLECDIKLKDREISHIKEVQIMTQRIHELELALAKKN